MSDRGTCSGSSGSEAEEGAEESGRLRLALSACGAEVSVGAETCTSSAISFSGIAFTFADEKLDD